MEFDFEQGLKRLTEISELMSGKITLEKSVELYSEAVQLVKKCEKAIEEAKISIETAEKI